MNDANTTGGEGRDWYLNAVIYELDVKNFQDSNGDGIGDLPGLTTRLPYLRDLGVDAVWLQPIYTSPRRDNGYDIADYRSIDPDLGTLDEFDAFVRAANALGLRVLLDLPLNHTSDQHAWFQSARSDRNSPYRDYYLWVDELPANPSPYPVFGPGQDGNWEYDAVAGQYYFHTFYRFMPDLNMANPRVCEEVLDVARFWLEHGVHGFRLDALPFVVEDRAAMEHIEEPHDLLRRLRRLLDELRPDGVLLAEANLPPLDMRPYFGRGDGDEVHLLLNFYLCNHIFLSLATGEAHHIGRAWDELPSVPERCGWANFLRNHDELSLDQLTDSERQRVFDAFAPDESMRLYGRGVRRRLAPMLNGDPRRVKLAYSLLFSLPGVPVVNAGEELGLGDDLRLEDREAARTPMQWSEAANAGFSTAPADQLVRPVVRDGPFSYHDVNVARQESDPASLLSFFRRAIATYAAHPTFSRGEWSFLKSDQPDVLVHCCTHEGRTAYAIHNLRDAEVAVHTNLPDGLTDLLADADYAPVQAGVARLGPFGFRWLRPAE